MGYAVTRAGSIGNGILGRVTQYEAIFRVIPGQGTDERLAFHDGSADQQSGMEPRLPGERG